LLFRADVAHEVTEQNTAIPAGAGIQHAVDQYTAKSRRVTECSRCISPLLHPTWVLPCIYRATLQPGQGLIGNNVLHDCSGFEEDKDHKQLLYRLHYYQRIAET
jgi:hypothetical protein